MSIRGERIPIGDIHIYHTHKGEVESLKNCAFGDEAHSMMIDLYWHVNYVEKGVVDCWQNER